MVKLKKLSRITAITLLSVALLCSCTEGRKVIEKESKNRYESFSYTEVETASVTKSAACSFTEDEMKEQIEAGKQLVKDLKEAASDLSKSSYTIPAGNYGFVPNKEVNGVKSAFLLKNIERPDDNPFTIYCEGVTFWIKPTGLPCANTVRSFHLQCCSNLTFVGLTIDEYSPTDFEGVVTKIDYNGNRIAIKLNDNSMVPTAENMKKAVNGSQSRIVPYKANGDLIAPLYKIDDSWGPGALWVDGFTAADDENEYWLSFQSTLLLETIQSESWKEAYGSAGIIEVGDTISYLYANMFVCLDNCKQITMDGFVNRISKGMLSETGGYGGHVWKNCTFGAADDTGKFIGGSEFMMNGTRVGTTLYNCTLLGSSDDQINIHSYWSEVDSVNRDGSVKLKYAIVGIEAGDEAMFYDKNGNHVATLKLTETPDNIYTYEGFLTGSVKFDGDLPDGYEEMYIRWPSMECNNWKITDCTFLNNYQRLLIQCGSGTFENNKVILMGSDVAIDTSTADYEGSIIGDITFKNNVFVSSSVCPSLSCFNISQNAEWGGKAKTGTITIEDNVFVCCGNLLSVRNAESVLLRHNLIVEPSVNKKTFDEYGDLFTLKENVDNFTDENNLLLSSDVKNKNDEQSKITKKDAEKARLFARYAEYDAETIVNDLWENLK